MWRQQKADEHIGRTDGSFLSCLPPHLKPNYSCLYMRSLHESYSIPNQTNFCCLHFTQIIFLREIS